MKFLLLTTALFAAASDADLGGGGVPAAADSATAPTPTPEPTVVVPVPAKGADFDTIAAQHQELLAAGDPAVAAAFHKKYVLGFKSK